MVRVGYLVGFQNRVFENCWEWGYVLKVNMAAAQSGVEREPITRLDDIATSRVQGWSLRPAVGRRSLSEGESFLDVQRSGIIRLPCFGISGSGHHRGVKDSHSSQHALKTGSVNPQPRV